MMRTYEEIAAIIAKADDKLFDTLTDDAFDSFHDENARERFLATLATIGITEDEFWIWDAE